MGRIQMTMVVALVLSILTSLSSFADAGLGNLNDTDPTYVAVTTDGVAFIQWTESKGNLTGQYQALYVNAYNPLKLESVNAAFTGVRSGSALTITFSGFLSSKTVTGTLRGGTLTLVVPNASGLLVQYTFKAGSVNDYNRAALTLRNRVERRAILAAQRRAVQTGQAELQDAYENLLHDTVKLAEDTDFARVWELYANDWERMQENHAKLQADAARQSLTCVQLGRVKADLSRLEVNMGSFEVHNGSFDIVRRRVLGDIQRVNRGIHKVQGALQNLHTAIAADHTRFVPSPSRYLDEVSRRISDIVVRSRKQIQLSTTEVQRAEVRSRDYNRKASELLQEASEFVKSLTCYP